MPSKAISIKYVRSVWSGIYSLRKSISPLSVSLPSPCCNLSPSPAKNPGFVWSELKRQRGKKEGKRKKSSPGFFFVFKENKERAQTSHPLKEKREREREPAWIGWPELKDTIPQPTAKAPLS